VITIVFVLSVHVPCHVTHHLGLYTEINVGYRLLLKTMREHDHDWAGCKEEWEAARELVLVICCYRKIFVNTISSSTDFQRAKCFENEVYCGIPVRG